MSLTKFVVLLFGLTLALQFVEIQAYSAPPTIEKTPAFESVIPKEFSNFCEPIKVSHLPPVHSIDGLPICGSDAALTLYLQDGCKKSNTDCSSLDPTKIPSVLSLAAIADQGDINEKMVPVPRTQLNKNNPLSIDTFHDLDFVLLQAQKASVVLAGSCYAFDQFVSRFSHGTVRENAVESEAAFLRLKENYSHINLEATGACIECLNQLVKVLQDDFAIFDNINDVQEALKKGETFEQFLHRVLLGSCKTGVKFDLHDYARWPDKIQTSESYPTAINKFKDVLSHDTPIGLNLCADKPPVGNLKDCAGHSLVVSGYNRACKQKSDCKLKAEETPKGECKDLLQVHNSWGADWQRLNNDGWLDAETLIKYSDLGRSSQILYFTSPGLK